MKRLTQSIASLALGGLILYAVLRAFSLQQLMASVRQTRPGLLALGFALMVLAYLVRGARWQIWETSLSYWNSLRLILIGYMGNDVLPARLGEVLRAHCAAAKTSDDRGRTTVLASIGVERVLDGLVIGIGGIVAVALVPVNRRLQWGLFLVSLAFVGLALGLAFGIRFHEKIRSFVAGTSRKFPGHITAFGREKINQFLDGLLPLGKLPLISAAMAATVLVWTIEVASYYFIGLAVWGGMKVSTALLFVAVVNFASLIPVTTGGIGTIEAAASPFLLSAGVPAYLALPMVLLQHAGQYLFATISGGISYLGGGFYRIPLDHPKSAATRQPAPVTDLPDVQVLEQTRSILGHLGESVELRPAPKGDIQLSIVVPAYNEQARLPRTVLETIRWCTSRDVDFELIIADDGSRDGTLELARLFEQSDLRIRALACPHMGKGATVRMGVLNAKGRYVLFMDADGATPLAEIPKLLAALEEGYDVAIGSRVAQHPGEVEVKTSSLRRFIGRSFAFFVNLFAFGGIGDTQCGFKMFRREASAAIFSRQKLPGFAFDVEVLFIAQRLSLSIAEIPVNWVSQPGSKVNVVTDSMKMLWDIGHIRWLHRHFRPSPSMTKEQELVANVGGASSAPKLR